MFRQGISLLFLLALQQLIVTSLGGVVEPAQAHFTKAPRPTLIPRPPPCDVWLTKRDLVTGDKKSVFHPCPCPYQTHVWPPRNPCNPLPCYTLHAVTKEKLTVPCFTPYPLPIEGNKPNCSPCTSSLQCKSRKCWGRKCTDGSYKDLLKCGFNKECEKCKSGLDCATKKCTDSKCVFSTGSKCH